MECEVLRVLDEISSLLNYIISVLYGVVLSPVLHRGVTFRLHRNLLTGPSASLTVSPSP